MPVAARPTAWLATSTINSDSGRQPLPLATRGSGLTETRGPSMAAR